MDKTLNIIQIAVSILLIAAILFQNKGAGLSETFGGGGGGGGGGGETYHTKRGFEKFLSKATIALAFAFLAIAVYSLAMSKIS